MDAAETLPMVLDAALTDAEEEELARHEAVIERGLGTFYEVGQALAAIRDHPRKLYREHGTFEDYCRERWGIVASRARQLISAAETTLTLESVTTVTPTNEWQVRPMMALPPEQQREVWTRAVASVPKGEVPTAKVVAQIAREVRGDVATPVAASAQESPPPAKKVNAKTQAHIDGASYGTLIVNATGKSADSLTNLPVSRLARSNAHLYLCVDADGLPDAFGVMDGWGFTCETVLTIGLRGGHVDGLFDGVARFVLFGQRGDCCTHVAMQAGVILADKDETDKPKVFYSLVKGRTVGPYLEMFPSSYHEHISVWGEETPYSAAPADVVQDDEPPATDREAIRWVLRDGLWRTVDWIAEHSGNRNPTVIGARCREMYREGVIDGRQKGGGGPPVRGKPSEYRVRG